MTDYPWPAQPVYPIGAWLSWRCPVTGERKFGRVHDVSWITSSIAQWAVDWLPRWLWWIGTNSVECVSYEITGADGREYSLYEADVEEKAHD